MVELVDGEARVRKLEQQAFFLKTLGSVLLIVGFTFGGFLSYAFNSLSRLNADVAANTQAIHGFPESIQGYEAAFKTEITGLAGQAIKIASDVDRAGFTKTLEQFGTTLGQFKLDLAKSSDRSFVFLPDISDSMLGELPTSSGAQSFDLPSSVATDAQEVLVFVSCATGPALIPRASGVTTYNIHTEINSKRNGFLFTVLGAAQNPGWAYNSQSFWLPVSSSSHKLYAEIQDGGGIGGDLRFFQSQVRVIGYR